MSNVRVNKADKSKRRRMTYKVIHSEKESQKKVDMQKHTSLTLHIN